MNDIRYVCLSDMHLGEEDSLLTNISTHGEGDPKHPSPVMKKLVECLRSVISQTNNGDRKPTLVLNGDILELALTTTEKAAMVFERFIELIMPPGNELFDKIFYIPGNHDHHLWEVAREMQYGNYIGHFNPGDDLEAPWHTTSMFVENTSEPVINYLLTKLVHRFPNLKTRQEAGEFIIPVAYPNFGLFKDDGSDKCVIFHHGHFTESIYHLMTMLKTLIFPESKRPDVAWEIEAENFAWIDFFWSTMGRSGDVGKDIELVYEKLQSQKQIEGVVSNLAKSLADMYNIPKIPDLLEDDVFKFILNRAVALAYGERSKTVEILSPDAEKGLWSYMEGPLKKQILIELDGSMPSDVTFIFGHTHKPFQEDMIFKGYVKEVNVYNTGGWVVESVNSEPRRGGAMILIDEELNATSLRLYNECKNQWEYEVKVEEAGFGKPNNPFHQHIAKLVDPESDHWNSFSLIVANEVRVRARNLRARINSSR